MCGAPVEILWQQTFATSDVAATQLRLRLRRPPCPVRVRCTYLMLPTQYAYTQVLVMPFAVWHLQCVRCH